MNETKINVKGMMCEGCEKRVENALKTIEGISDVKADHNSGKVIIKTDREISKDVMKEKIEDLDFELVEEN